LHFKKKTQKKKRTRVIIDANFLFLPIKFHIDIFEELQKVLNREFCPVILSSTYSEVKKLIERGPPKIKREANFALNIAKDFFLIEVSPNSNEKNDDVIVRMAKKWNCPVATNDIELKRKLRNDLIPVIYLREKSYLEMEGFVE
jgi:rRNA-processing protein FCF1